MNWEQQASKSEAELKAFIDDLYKDAFRKLKNIKLGTLWYRWTKTDKGAWSWEFNHLEDGHCQNSHPTSKQPIHNQIWKGSKWAKSYIQLEGDRSIVSHYIIT